MRELVYHVAVSTDGFIAHADGSVGGFLETGEHVDDYREQLQAYDTVLMGRKTYEFGYAFGLPPGQAPYPHMRNYVFSSGIAFPGTRADNLTVVREQAIEVARSLKQEPGGPIYLCGGSRLAGSFLSAGLIDRLILKVNPAIFGRGTTLFGQALEHPGRLSLESSRSYDNGVQLNEYRLMPD